MKIIKPGIPLSPTYTFTCGRCACVFEADVKECSRVGSNTDGYSQRCECPQCDEWAYYSVSFGTDALYGR